MRLVRVLACCVAVLLSAACSRSYQTDSNGDYYSCIARVVGLSEQGLGKRIEADGNAPELAPDVATKLVEQHRDDVQTCYGRTLQRRGLRVGTIRAKVAVAPSGEVLRAAVEHNDTSDDELVCCVVDALMSWRFPERAAGIANATVPFSFMPPTPQAATGASPQDLARFQQEHGSCTEAPTHRDSQSLASTLDVSTPASCSGCGSLKKSAIQEVVTRESNSVRWCYDVSRLVRPTLQARAVVELEVGADGKVTRSTMYASDTNYAPLDCCLTRAVAKWTFPKPDGGGRAIVRYPFELKMGTAR